MFAVAFNSPAPILSALDAVYGPKDHDSHVSVYRVWKRAYGDWAGYHIAMMKKANSRAKLMETEEGRAFLARIERAHRKWEESR